MNGKTAYGEKEKGQDSKRDIASHRLVRVGTALVAGVAALAVGGCCTLGKMMCKECRDLEKQGRVTVIRTASGPMLDVDKGLVSDSLCAIWGMDETRKVPVSNWCANCPPDCPPEPVKVNHQCSC